MSLFSRYGCYFLSKLSPELFTLNQPLSVMQIPTPRGMLLIKFFICIFGCCQFIFDNSVYAIQNGSQKVSIVANNQPLKTILRQIEKQSGLRFIYSNDAIDNEEKVSVNFNQVQLENVLNAIFNSRGIVWEYRESIISLRVKSGQKKNMYQEDFVNHPPDLIVGKILDENGLPIPGASIMIKGTARGTKTNVDGSFSISNVSEGSTLLIMSLGYERREILVGSNKNLVINLVIAPGMLNEKVVVAYGISTRKNIIGNVASVGAKQLESSPVNNPLLALQGRVPGIFISQVNGYSGSGISTMIQGQNSLKNGNDPFYVIDGVPYISQFLPNYGDILGTSGNNLASTGNPLSLINPSDIESITILKDAEATSIYGSRAANGAILITTKKGKPGPMKIDLNIQQGWQKVTKTPKLLNTKEYLEMRHEALINDGLSVSETDYDINGFWDTTRSTNWFKELVGRTAQYTNINGSISGGTTNLQYRIGGTYHRETVVIPGNFDDKKGSVNFSLSGASVNQKFHIQFTSSYLLDNNELPTSDLTSVAFTMAPTAPSLYNKDGSLNWMPNSSGQTTFFNPLKYIYDKYNAKSSNFIGNSVLEYNILPGLDISASLGYNTIQTNETIVKPLAHINPNSIPRTNRVGVYGKNSISSWIVEPQITYKKGFGNSHFDFLLGSTIQQRVGEGSKLQGIGYNNDGVIKDFRAATRLVAVASIYSVYKYNALFGRLNYNYNGKYLINAAIRRDGTSRFGSANKFHNFGSVAVGWIFSEEKLLSEKLSFLSFGKIRASYGTTGSDQIPDYSYLSLYSPYSVGVPYRGIGSLIPTLLTNPYLTWEETKKISVGVDFGIFKDRILVGITKNVNKSNKQLVSKDLPYTAGISSIAINLPATVQNTGWEITLDSKNIQSKIFNWTTSFNITIPRNKLLSYPGLAQSTDANVLYIGKSVNTVKVFKFAGVNPITGVYQFNDSKGGLTDNPDYLADRLVYVNLDPKFYGGIQNSLTYRSFGLDVLFQFVKKNNYNGYFGNGEPGIYYNNQPKVVMQRWRKEGDNSTHQKFNSDYSINLPYSYATVSDRGISDASYIRLKNISFSWNAPKKWLNRVNIRDLKLSLQAQNLLTISNYIGSDPELGTFSLPPLRSYVLGLQMSL